jgi:LuxR family maltose regulon positive regulatory protein
MRLNAAQSQAFRKKRLAAVGLVFVRNGGGGGSPLTPAELRLLPYLQTHLTIREIAKRLFVSHNTVNSQVSSVYRKLGVSSRDEAVRRATAVGLLGG